MKLDKDALKPRAEGQLRWGTTAALQIALGAEVALPIRIGNGYPNLGTVWLYKLMTSLDSHNMRELKAGRNPVHTTDRKKRCPARSGDGFDPYEIVTNRPGFIELVTPNLRSVETKWPAHVLQWIGKPNVNTVRYDNMVNDCAPTLAEAMRQGTAAETDMGLPSPIADRFAFARTSTRKPGEDDRSSIQRGGTAGDRKNHFNLETAECAESLRSVGCSDGGTWAQTSDPQCTTR